MLDLRSIECSVNDARFSAVMRNLSGYANGFQGERHEVSEADSQDSSMYVKILIF